MPRPVPREKDDLVLAWLALREAGQGWTSIARAYGVKNATTVRDAVMAVQRAIEADT
jgi:hypothetical protein